MSDARSNILRRLGLGTRPRPAPAEPEPLRRFDWDRDELIRRFCDRLAAVQGEVHLVGDDWPRVLARLLRQRNVRRLAYGPKGPQAALLGQELAATDCCELVAYDVPVEMMRSRLFDEVDAAFTCSHGGIAETGSVVLWPDGNEPRLLSLVAPIHVVLLDAGRIVSTLHELMVEQNWAAGMPTNPLLISGPSKSADIEQTLTYGVHGPKELIVLVREFWD